jgi:histidinol dehydrogenase
MRLLDSTQPGFHEALSQCLESRADPAPAGDMVGRVRAIIDAVRTGGDTALVALTRELDRFDPGSPEGLIVSAEERAAALEAVGPVVRADLQCAHDRIAVFHRRQREPSWSFETEDGVRLAQRTIPLRRVGLYVPGGTASYPSSVLMNAVPAKVAGVDELVMVTPTPDGRLNAAVIAAAAIAGVDRIVRVGGAQAVAALAFGTTLVPRVDKIVGPGNAWVATAKREVFGRVGIDSIAGPSELCVVATRDGGASAALIAADLLSQAEHDPLAMVSLLSPDRGFIDEIIAEVHRQAAALPRHAIATASVRDFGLAIVTRSLDEALTLSDLIAPEHLELVIPDAERHAETIRSAGAIFCGPHTPEAVGDYIAGPNHVLPTNGTARFFSPLGVQDFVRRTNIVRFSAQGLAELGPAVVRLAELEGLEAHAASVRRRLGGGAHVGH